MRVFVSVHPIIESIYPGMLASAADLALKVMQEKQLLTVLAKILSGIA